VAEETIVTSWELIGTEQMGEPGKSWLEDPDTGARWLFKPVRIQNDPRGAFPQGQDWAEKIAADLAETIGLPSAQVELARRGDEIGSISRDIGGGRGLSLGNELLAAHDPNYPADKIGTVSEYTLDRIFEVLSAAEVASVEVSGGTEQTALSLFAGFLVLDAWVANQDRHHGNWGVLEDLVGGAAPYLAPSFDHGSSLGFQMRDDDKRAILDRRGGIDGWAHRGECRPMSGRPNLVELAHRAIEIAGAPALYWAERLGGTTSTMEASVVEAISGVRMSQVSRMFAKAVLETNRTRLLDGI
jgi:hypothetical protein